MLFGKRRILFRTGGESFADGFLDGYHFIHPDREPDRVPERHVPIGSAPYQCGYRSGCEQAVMESDTDTDLDEDW